MSHEFARRAGSGWAVLIVTLVGYALTAYLIFLALQQKSGLLALGALLLLAACIVLDCGLFIVNPNEARVLQLFGKYVGTVKDVGFHFANPLYTKTPVSLRLHNFETGSQGADTAAEAGRTRRPSKVNDRDGNPVEIAAVVSWRVVDTFDAVFSVDNYTDYVTVQSEASMRNLASLYPYDSADDHVQSLRGDTEAVAEKLQVELQRRLAKAGVEVVEARISHLAYAPEIAAAMLQRQQAGAIIAARQKIVEGAVGMVEDALNRLAEKKIVALDDERRAAMVSNLLVVLCSQSGTQPVVNAGTIY
jgi:regulator of protease activity HflC (stomatin/prohibitin superfamily)